MHHNTCELTSCFYYPIYFYLIFFLSLIQLYPFFPFLTLSYYSYSSFYYPFFGCCLVRKTFLESNPNFVNILAFLKNTHSSLLVSLAGFSKKTCPRRSKSRNSISCTSILSYHEFTVSAGPENGYRAPQATPYRHFRTLKREPDLTT